MRVSEIVANYLVEELKLTHFFGVSGANIEDLFLALDSKTKIILAKHEFNAATMCDGYFRASQKMAVLLTTSGGGALNIVPALAESYASRIPLLAIVGAAPITLEGKGAFQDSSGQAETLNLEKIYQEITTYCVKISKGEELLTELALAYSRALSHNRPSVVIVPKNFWSEELANLSLPKISLPTKEVSLNDSTIAFSKNCLLILGEELCRLKNNQKVLSLIKNIDAFTMVTPEAKALPVTSHPKFLGVAGVMGELNKKLYEFEQFIILGSRFGVMERFGIDKILMEPAKKVFTVSQYETFFRGNNVTNIRIKDEREFGETVVNVLTHFGSTDLATVFCDVREPVLDKHAVVSINQLGFLLNSTFDSEPYNWVFDAGNVVCNAVKTVNVKNSSTFTIALGMGGMGFSFGAAIGATLSNENYSILLAGDGAFYMSGMEIHTAVQYKLPTLFIIVNNNAHGMCMTREQLFFNRQSEMNRFFKADLASGLSGMFPGFKTFEINCYQDWYQNKDEFLAIIKKRGPFAIVINVDVHEVPEFLPFKKD